ncbi:MAG TPA: glycoside hydrolase family 5 protein, partial [Thermotogota bacterium]|nr:glycoside hydrolase family 5 protein [Thermotogota bacterium]
MTKVVLFSVTIFMIFLSGCSINYMPTYSSTISKGINIGCALEAPEEGEWGIIIEERFFDLIVERGFESVRLPIRWSAHTPNFPPYTIDNIFLLRVEEVVQQALERGLKVIINVHHFEELMINPDAQEEKFYSIWEQITQHFKDYPDTLYFELLNEPEGLLNTDKWNTMQLEAINRIRAINKDRWIIITGAPGGLSEAL